MNLAHAPRPDFPPRAGLPVAVRFPAGRKLCFGRFQIYPSQKKLLEGDRPVRLGSRALDILLVLMANAGELVGKSELMAQVWPDTFVEDANLSVHIAALRKALGDGKHEKHYVATIPGRGYQFVAPITYLDDPAHRLSESSAAARLAPTLPTSLTRLFGQDAFIEGIVREIGASRLVTIVGHGGIGKTAVALAAASRMAGAIEQPIHFVDLASLKDPGLLPAAIAAAAGGSLDPGQAERSWMSVLRHRRMLLILDGCEGIINAAADLVEDILQQAPGVSILATSREALRARGEQVVRLAPLSLPRPSPRLTAEEALHSPAVQMFVDRAASILHGYGLNDATAPMVAEICCRLDGIPLAIELAASRIDVFGTAGIAEGLVDNVSLLCHGRRTSLPRHRSLTASLDWSYQLLSELERSVLDHVTLFRHAFTLDAAIATLPSGMAPFEFIEGMAGLVAKSLLLVDLTRPSPHYRLFDTTRNYVLSRRHYSESAKPLHFVRTTLASA